MNAPPPVHRVHVVDDDVAVVRSIALLLGAAGFSAVEWSSPRAFLHGADLTPPCCVVLDVQMPELAGPEVQNELRRRGSQVPVVFLTAHADVPTSVRALKGGAADFLLKPVVPAELLEVVGAALRRSNEVAAAAAWVQALRRRFEGLTPREREVFERIVQGASNREAAEALGLSENTLKTHRLRAMEKMRAESLAELVQMAMALGVLTAMKT